MLTDSLGEILVEWQPAAGRPGVRVVPSLTVVGFGPPAATVVGHHGPICQWLVILAPGVQWPAHWQGANQ